MKFTEWCKRKYGITRLSDGKIENYVALPAIGRSQIRLNDRLQKYGYVVVEDGVEKFILTEKNFRKLKRELRDHYSQGSRHRIDEGKNQTWRWEYLADLGIDIDQKSEYRTLPYIHVHLDESNRQKFADHFRNYGAHLTHSAVYNKKEVVSISPAFLKVLRDEYAAEQSNQNQSSRTGQPTDVQTLKFQRQKLSELLGRMRQHDLYERIDHAQRLALDYTNEGIATHEACSAYALSLEAYAELYSDQLSAPEYRSTLAASHLLAAYDERGNLAQSLKTDANFTDYIRFRLYTPIAEKEAEKYDLRGNPLIEDLPNSKYILNEIAKNADDLLYGNPRAPLGKGKTFAMHRFLPGQSGTDEIILQAGGMSGHSAVIRIIKRGVMVDGSYAKEGERPHHYDYFRVENNVGAGCHEVDRDLGTCNSTHITKITPFTLNRHDELVPSKVDPFDDPETYQQDMTFTLKEIIKTERKLLCYKPAKRGPNGEREAENASREAREWNRLHDKQIKLSGIPYKEPVEYFARDTVDPTKRYLCRVENQRGRMQQAGSCPILTPKSVVASVMTATTATLHTNFMQTHSSHDLVQAVQSKIYSLDQRIQAAECPRYRTPPAAPAGGKGTFFDPRTPRAPRIPYSCQVLERELGLPIMASMQDAFIADDIHKQGKQVLMIRCPQHLIGHLCEQLEKITPKLQSVTVSGDCVILGEDRVSFICKTLEADFNRVWQALPYYQPNQPVNFI